MKQYDVNKLYEFLEKIHGVKFKASVANDIYNMYKKVKVAYFGELEKEKNMLAEYSGTIDDDGSLKFRDEDSANGFYSKLTEMNNADVDIDIGNVVIPVSSISHVEISLRDMENLEGIIEFQ